VEILKKFIKKNKIVNPYIISHSMSSWYATKIALDKTMNVQKIIFVDPLGFTISVPKKQKLLSFALVAKLISHTAMSPTKQHIKQFLQESHFNPNTLEDDFIDYVHESIHLNTLTHPFSLLHRIVGFHKIRKDFLLNLDVSKLHIPIHIISGAEDPLIDSDELIKAITPLTMVSYDILPNVGHVPPIENHKDFHLLSRRFLR